MKCLIHVHTQEGSECANISIQNWLDVCEKNQIDCLVVTDHNEINPAQKLQKLASFKVVVGEEIKTREGEIIGLFLKQKIKANLSILETIREIRKQKGLVYLPHPFSKIRLHNLKFSTLQKIFQDIDIIEIYNSRSIFQRENQFAEVFAKKYHLIPAVGSDSHSIYEISAYLEMPDFQNPKEFLQSLKRAKLYKIKSPIWAHLLSTYSKIKNKIFQK